jgi:hypothetical protein
MPATGGRVAAAIMGVAVITNIAVMSKATITNTFKRFTMPPLLSWGSMLGEIGRGSSRNFVPHSKKLGPGSLLPQ